MSGDLCIAPGIISLLSLATDVTDVTLGASGHWLGTRTGAGGIAKMEHVNPITLKNWLKAFVF